MQESSQFNHLFNSRQYAHIVRIIVPIWAWYILKVWAIVYHKQIGRLEPLHRGGQ